MRLLANPADPKLCTIAYIKPHEILGSACFIIADERAVAIDRQTPLFISSKYESSPVALVDSMLRKRLF